MRKQDYIDKAVNELNTTLASIIGHSVNVARYGGALGMDEFSGLTKIQELEVRKAFDTYRKETYPFDFGKYKNILSTSEILN